MTRAPLGVLLLSCRLANPGVSGVEYAMAEGLFALAGAVLGILGTVLADLARSRVEDRRDRRAVLRSTCADFTTALAHIRQLCYDRHATGPDEALTNRMRVAYGGARAQYERLRLTTSSSRTQEEARLALRAALWFWQEVQGEWTRGTNERSPVAVLEDHLTALYIGIRQELDVPNAQRVFAEPEESRRLPREPGAWTDGSSA